MFAECVANSYSGIDCGFFLGDAYAPPRLVLPEYFAVAFDAGPEPDFESCGRTVIRAHHSMMTYSAIEWVKGECTLISDLPYDYLALYAQAAEVHSDRVHACVAALAYSRPARLYSSTPRGRLFDSIGASGIRDGLVRVDPAALEAQKTAQVDYVRSLIENCVQGSRQ